LAAAESILKLRLQLRQRLQKQKFSGFLEKEQAEAEEVRRIIEMEAAEVEAVDHS
jgi:hypothetical protein